MERVAGYLCVIPNPRNKPLFNDNQIVKIIRNLLIIDSFLFCYQTMDNLF